MLINVIVNNRILKFLDIKNQTNLNQATVNYSDLILKNDDFYPITGKFFSEALFLALTNSQYDKRLSIDLQVQYMKITSSEHVVYINCSECQNKNKKQFVYTTCSESVLSLQFSCTELVIQ